MILTKPDSHKSTDFGLVLSTHLCLGLSVNVLGKPLDMRLGELSHPRDMISAEVRKVYLELSRHLRSFGVKRCLLPKVNELNAVFGGIESHVFDLEFSTSGSVPVYKNNNSIDAFTLPAGYSCLMRSADCPTLILFNEEHPIVVVAHCSRDSLICRQELLNGVKDRQHFSVIQPTVNVFKKLGVPADDIHAHISCGIAGEYFRHKPDDRQYGKYNRALSSLIANLYGAKCFHGPPQDGCIKLHEVIRAQLSIYGISNVTHDQLDTFSDQRLHSNRAGGIGRNGVLVINNMAR